ncbi:MAG: response regulator transcription factor [Bacteroidales bacterium]|nr:response regulator transcription factor [Bacteroidales bacterium]
MTEHPKIRVAIVDDHQLFRNGLKFIIGNESDMEVIIEASNGKEFVFFLENMKPDLVLMDINMPEMDGVETTRQALQKYPDLNVLVLSMYGDVEYYNTMIDLGVKGFILKDIDNNELTNAIRKIFGGGNYFSQELLLNLIKHKPEKTGIDLTKREKEVLELICKGHSNQQISEELFISQRTVERHRSSLLNKTDSKNSVSLVVYAIKNHLVKI